MSSITLPRRGARRRRSLMARTRGWGNWIYLLPAALFFFMYMAYPILRSMWMSFTNYQYLSTEPAQFVGLQNFANALNDPLFHLGLLRAATFTAIFLPGVIFIPLFVAILVDRVGNQRLATVYRLILLIPAVIPAAMIFVLWRWLYDFEIGPINTILRDYLHLFNSFNAPQWVGVSPLALPAVAFVEIWWGLGYHTMFFLAGLASIPRELFEAARVDGASEWQMFWHVTLPRLQPIMLILVILRFGSAMAVIDDFIIMGGFNRALPTYTWTVYMWHMAFQLGTWPQGYASAVGWLGAGAMLIVVAIMMYVFRNRD
ncbi:MAG: sugar ABC transporter permease [Chloroflexi bacterium HGW-Chloroflexi-1]|nr:MAG: sugar ABC transporter permease [Chloroflexi bacterium HGW-Chloroflexi-1]